VDDILKSIKAYLYDRSSSPLFGAFVLSWSAWNYKFIVALFTAGSLQEKFTFIEPIFSRIEIEIFGHGFWFSGAFVNGFFVPALVAYAYLYAYPRLAKPVYEHSLKMQKELRELKQKTEDNRLLSVEESRELHKKLTLLQSEFDKATESYQQELTSLRQIIAQSESTTDEANLPERATVNSSRQLSKREEAILKVFSGRADEENVSDARVHEAIGGPIDVVRMLLDDLAEKGFLMYSGTPSQSKAKLYVLRPKGRKYIVTHDLLGTVDLMKEEVA
jgi:hypothetical protein